MAQIARTVCPKQEHSGDEFGLIFGTRCPFAAMRRYCGGTLFLPPQTGRGGTCGGTDIDPL
jgi:hypothetical protein